MNGEEGRGTLKSDCECCRVRVRGKGAIEE